MGEYNRNTECYSNIYGRYMSIEGALMFFADGLKNLSEKPEITSEDVLNGHAALAMIIQQMGAVNDLLDIEIRMTTDTCE